MNNYHRRALYSTIISILLATPFILTGCQKTEPPTVSSLISQYCPTINRDLLTEARTRGSLNVLAIGSSTTEGIGASRPELNYVSRLRADLIQHLPHVKVQVTNAGSGGQTLEQINNRWTQAITENGTPDTIILQTGINDSLQNVNQEAFKRLLDTLLASASQNSFIAVMGNQYLGENEDTRVPLLRAFNTLIIQSASYYKSPYINRHDLFKSLIEQNFYQQNELYISDLLHSSDKGYEILEKCVAHQIFGI